MTRIESLSKRQRTHALAIKLIVMAMALAVTALFSIVPFKVPRVYFFPIDIQVKASQPHVLKTLQAPGPERLDGAINGTPQKRMDLDPQKDVLLPVAFLLAGLRCLASLPGWRARGVCVPRLPPYCLRAPPSLA